MNETLEAWAPRVLSVLRIYTGLLLLEHGTAKISRLSRGSGFRQRPYQYDHSERPECSNSLAACFFTIGLFTRPVAFILSGFAAVAYFMVTRPKDSIRY